MQNMYATNIGTGSSGRPRPPQQNNSNHSILNRYSRNGSQSHLTPNKKHNPAHLLYEIPEQYNSGNSYSARSKSNLNKIFVTANNNSNEGLFKNNYQISFNQNRKKSTGGFTPTTFVDSKRNGSKASMSPNTYFPSSSLRGSSESSDGSSTLVNSETSKIKTHYPSSKSLLDLVSEHEKDNSEEGGELSTNLHKQLRINQKLSIMKQNMEKKSDLSDGITNPQTYFYSDIKFVNDEVNHQYKNMKLLRSKEVLNIKKKDKNQMYVNEKYLELTVKSPLAEKEDKNIFIDHPDDIVSYDFLQKLAEDAWMKAEQSLDFTHK